MIGLDAGIDEVEAFGRKRRAGGQHAAQRRQAVRDLRLPAGLLDRVDVLGRGAEDGHALGIGEVEEHAFGGVEWRTVVEQQRRTRGEAGDQPVPHHPAAGGEVEQPVGGLCVGIQHMLGQMLEQDAARRDARCIWECPSCRTNRGCRADDRRASARRRWALRHGRRGMPAKLAAPGQRRGDGLRLSRYSRSPRPASTVFSSFSTLPILSAMRMVLPA